MAVFRPFRAFRPTAQTADKIPALPYDVMNTEEARQIAAGNPLSFLYVDKAEINFPAGTDPYSPAVYEAARDRLLSLEREGHLVQDPTPCLYLYRQVMDGRTQTGIVGCAGIDDYLNNTIKKHEFTRAEKEADRIRHVDTCDANTGPIFLTYRTRPGISKIVSGWIQGHGPAYDFTTGDGVRHTVWVVDEEAAVQALSAAFSYVPALYIADGHHRCASAVKVALKRREANPDYTGEEEYNYFLAVAFPDEELEILDYNRVVADLNGHAPQAFLEAVGKQFAIEKDTSGTPVRPLEKHTFGMYLEGSWYRLCAKEGTFDAGDPVARLDVSILQNNLLSPILGIGDPRTDKRIDFVGGIRGLEELERRAQDDMRLAFSMYPTTISDLMAIADAGAVMPPKSTWFEPKLLSGLFIHPLSCEA